MGFSSLVYKLQDILISPHGSNSHTESSETSEVIFWIILVLITS
jgi:hypothetical protein